MRSILQIVLVLVVIVASIFGITFINQYKPASDIDKKGEPPPPPPGGADLIFPVKTMEWDPESAGEREMNHEGYWDFWFENRKDLPVDLGLVFKSCKCTHLEVAILPNEEAKRYRQRLFAEAALPVLRGHGGALDWMTQAAIEQYLTHTSPVGTVKPRPLDEHRYFVVPPQHAGFVRMNWDGKKEGAERLTVELRTQQRGEGPHPSNIERLQLPIKFVSPIRIHQPTPRLEDLYPEKSGEIAFVCWSSTRAAFSLSAHEKNHDPCFVCSWAPLDDQQCALLADTVKARVLCGYEVKVQVHERLPENKKQLDLGPFMRQIVLSSDSGMEPGSTYISGVVRGELTIGTPEDKDRIAFAPFRSDRGATKTVTLWSDRPGLELDCNEIQVEPGELSYLKSYVQVKKKEATASPGGQSRWELTVKIPPDRVSGKLPENAAIFIKIQGTPRQIRVPITGTAYRL